ncbi:MAG: LysM peptidoglycan-binding domain-containing protein [Candidatus Omnitrophota bacterium]|nr:LysM peptidoglycan-binding domain-containing protein [Candidatus Omnitrophota bacterium]
MKTWLLLVAGFATLLMVDGCRAATRITTFPRVDLEMEGTGNRGYLIGSPPPAGELKTTREMLETDVEIPSFYKPKRGASSGGLEEITPPEMDMDDAGAAPAVAGPFDTYVVQKGDSLWSIASKPEIYGRATHWRRIFDANRDLLKSPDRVRAGMTLKIPRGEEGAGETTYGDEGISHKK